MAIQLGIMKAQGEVRVLEAQGIEPFTFLLLPRVAGFTVAAFCLTFIFIAAALASGYVFGTWLGYEELDSMAFLQSIVQTARPVDTLAIAVKSLLPAVLTGVICTTGGLSVARSYTQVPTGTKRALGRSLSALFLTFALISILAYL